MDAQRRAAISRQLLQYAQTAPPSLTATDATPDPTWVGRTAASQARASGLSPSEEARAVSDAARAAAGLQARVNGPTFSLPPMDGEAGYPVGLVETADLPPIGQQQVSGGDGIAPQPAADPFAGVKPQPLPQPRAPAQAMAFAGDSQGQASFPPLPPQRPPEMMQPMGGQPDMNINVQQALDDAQRYGPTVDAAKLYAQLFPQSENSLIARLLGGA